MQPNVLGNRVVIIIPAVASADPVVSLHKSGGTQAEVVVIRTVDRQSDAIETVFMSRHDLHHVIEFRYGTHDSFQIVIAVLPASQDVEPDIYFAVSP